MRTNLNYIVVRTLSSGISPLAPGEHQLVVGAAKTGPDIEACVICGLVVGRA